MIVYEEEWWEEEELEEEEEWWEEEEEEWQFTALKYNDKPFLLIQFSQELPL